MTAETKHWIRYFNRAYLLADEREYEAAREALQLIANGAEGAVIVAHTTDMGERPVSAVRILLTPGVDVTLSA